SEADLHKILESRKLDPGVARLAQGSASLALLLADTERQQERESFLGAVFEALAAPDLVSGLRLAESRRGDRQELGDLLGHFAQELSTRARELSESDVRAAQRLAEKHELVLATLLELEKNVQPALALESMIVRLRRA
ncbi:MAG TPA: hypothetical protein VGP93_14060, partial [Polyangiaceae bacterium]|nr:hypothetical protein [Polyangiaceae bacterium]